MKRTALFAAFVLSLFLGVGQSQVLVKEPDLPENYRQWPNVFQRVIKVQDEHTLTFRVYARKTAGSFEIEQVSLYTVDGDFDLIEALHFQRKRENEDVKLTYYLFTERGFLKLVAPHVSGAVIKRWRKAVEKKFGIIPKKLIDAMGLINDTVISDDLNWFLDHLVEEESIPQ